MTPLRQRFIEDMQLRGLAPTTQRTYVHYVGAFAQHYRQSPEHLDLEAVREYQLHLINERKLSPNSVNCATSAIRNAVPGHAGNAMGKRALPAGKRAAKASRSAQP